MLRSCPALGAASGVVVILLPWRFFGVGDEDASLRCPRLADPNARTTLLGGWKGLALGCREEKNGRKRRKRGLALLSTPCWDSKSWAAGN